MSYIGFYVTEHIREHAIQRAAGGVAMYMDSVVERHVQELAARERLGLERPRRHGGRGAGSFTRDHERACEHHCGDQAHEPSPSRKGNRITNPS